MESSPLPQDMTHDEPAGINFENPKNNEDAREEDLIAEDSTVIAFEIDKNNDNLKEEDSDTPGSFILLDKPELGVLITKTDNRVEHKFVVKLRDNYTGLIELSDPLITDDSVCHITLDLLAKVIRITDNKMFNIVSYYYERLHERRRIDILPLAESISKEDDIRALDFIFKQYCLFSHATSDVLDDRFLSGEISYDFGTRELDDENDQPNSVAKAFESGGLAVRRFLKSGGHSTGSAIRYLGAKYTNTALYWKGRSDANNISNNTNSIDPDIKLSIDEDDDQNQLVNINDNSVPTSGNTSINKPVDPKLIERAEATKKMGESVHASARALTSTLLYPVRSVGKVASKYASSNEKSVTNKAVLDTLGGLGNGFAAVFKGVTEGLEEIGRGIGDAAIEHSKKVHGEEFCESVTKKRLEAASQVGLGIYKVGNVASFGLAGIAVDAVIEGTTYLVSLYEYLVGPVILQAYVDIVTLPFVKKRKFFVVLRPWSIAIYSKSSDFTQKPYKIIATCMLDTIPLKRDGRSIDISNNLSKNQDTDDKTVSITIKKKKSLMSKLRGGDEKHIELTTVDCSTYLFYPPEEQLDLWFNELKDACLRVETISKRNSGAYELSITRRLRLLPKINIISISVKQIILSPVFTDKIISFDNSKDDDDTIDFLNLGEDEVPQQNDGIELQKVGVNITGNKEENKLIVQTEKKPSIFDRFTLTKKVESLKFSTLKNCYFDVLPREKSGVIVLDEKSTSPNVTLLASNTEEYKEQYNQYHNIVFSSHSDNLHVNEKPQKVLIANFEENCNFDLGHKASLIRSEVDKIDIKIYSDTFFNKNNRVELGRIQFLLEHISTGSCSYTWVDIFSKKRKKIVGKALVSLVQDGN